MQRIAVLRIAQRMCGKNTSVINLGTVKSPFLTHRSRNRTSNAVGVNSIRRIIIEEASRLSFEIGARRCAPLRELGLRRRVKKRVVIMRAS